MQVLPTPQEMIGRATSSASLRSSSQTIRLRFSTSVSRDCLSISASTSLLQ